MNRQTFELLKEGEEQEVCDFVMQVFMEAVATDYSPEGINEFARYVTGEALRKRLQGNHFALVARDDDKIIGMVEVMENRHIAMLFVGSDRQGTGVGAELVRRSLSLIRSHDPHVREITVHSAPLAVGFYRRLGFREDGPENVVNGIRFIPMSLRF